MASHSVLRPMVLALAAAAVVGVAVDTGSIAFTRLSADHDVQTVGQAAVTAVQGRPVTSDSATRALRVAVREGHAHHLMVQRRNFKLYRDGRLQLVATATAPTVLLRRLQPFEHLTQITARATVTASPYS